MAEGLRAACRAHCESLMAERLDVGFIWKPSDSFYSGDSVGLIEKSHHQVTLLLSDAAGKGSASSLLSNRLDLWARDFLLDTHCSPAQLLAHLNAQICHPPRGDHYPPPIRQNLAPSFCNLASMLCVEIDLQDSKLTLANAGHEPLIVWWEGQEPMPIFAGEVCDFALGMVDEYQYHQRILDLKKGFGILAYTDGLTECTRFQGGGRFGHQRLLDLLRQYWRQTWQREAYPKAQRLASAIYQWVDEFTGSIFEDDMTLVVLACKG